MWCCVVGQQFRTFRSYLRTSGTAIQQHFVSRKTCIFRSTSLIPWISQSVRNVTTFGSHSDKDHVWRGPHCWLQVAHRRGDQRRGACPVCCLGVAEETITHEVNYHNTQSVPAASALTVATNCQLISKNPILVICYSHCHSMPVWWHRH